MIVKEDKVLMIRGSAEDVLFDLITICFAIHKKMGIPKEVLVETIAKGLLAMNDEVLVHEFDFSKGSEGFKFPKDFPSEEFFKSQGCKNEDEYWEKMKDRIINKDHKDPKEVEMIINLLKKKFPFPNTTKKESTTEDAENQFKSMFGDLLNE